MLPPGAPEFSAWFSQFNRSCFRLETLQRYRGSGEDDSIRAFLAGDNPAPHPGKLEWMRLVSTAVRAGKTMQRVHVVLEPSSDYVMFEVAWSYAYSVSAGEDVRLVPIDVGASWPQHICMDDFWLFDDQELFHMIYDDEDAWVGIDHVKDPTMIARACTVREAALATAQPWGAYISARPALASRVPDVQWPS